MYCITSIHVQTFLTSIHVASQIQTRSRCTRLTSSHFTYQIPLDQKNCISAQSHSHLTISRSQSVSQLKPSLYQLHPGHEMYISHPFMSTLTSIKVPVLASHLHSSNISLAFMSHLNLIQVTIIAYQLRLGANIHHAYHFHPHSVSTPWGPLNIHLTSIHPSRVSYQTKS